MRKRKWSEEFWSDAVRECEQAKTWRDLLLSATHPTDILRRGDRWGQSLARLRQHCRHVHDSREEEHTVKRDEIGARS